MKELKINIERTGLPIKIGEFDFFFDASVEKVDNYQKQYDEIMLKVNELEDKGNRLENETDALKLAYDTILGEGTFDKLYTAYRDVLALDDAFHKMVNGIDKYLEEFKKQKTDESDNILKAYNAKKKQIMG